MERPSIYNPAVVWVTFSFILLFSLLIVCAVTALGMALMLLRPPRMSDAKAVYLLKRLSPGDLGLAFETLWFDIGDKQTGNSLRFAAWWIPSEQARGKCVIIIHGYADAKVGGIAWAPMWHSLGWNILAIDLRAHGESQGRNSTSGYWERHDLHAIINDIRARRPAETQRLVLFGISLGGAVALATAAMRDDLHAVIAECPYAEFEHAVYRHAKVMNMPARSLQPLGVKLAAWLSGADFREVAPVRTVLAARCPVLVVSSAEDELVTPHDMDALERAVASRDPQLGASEFWRVQQADHVLGIACDPQEYRQRIDAFLSRIEQDAPQRAIHRAQPGGADGVNQAHQSSVPSHAARSSSSNT